MTARILDDIDWRRGYVRVPRSLVREEFIVQHPTVLRVLLFYLGEVHPSARRITLSTGQIIALEPGEIFTSRATVERALALSPKQVRTADQLLELHGLIARKVVRGVAGRRAHAGTVISVELWRRCEDAFQAQGQTAGQTEGQTKGKPRANQGQVPEILYVQYVQEIRKEIPIHAGNGSAGTPSAAEPVTPVRLPEGSDDPDAITRRVIDYFNRRSGRRFTAAHYRELVHAALAAGHTERELRLVAWWAEKYEWPEGHQYREKNLRPSTLYTLAKTNGARTFAQYLDLAREAYEAEMQHAFNPLEEEEPSHAATGRAGT
jgi:uncharacterized phage protein (TIGR02220 family)